jgi:hypothetical protein
MVKKVKTGFLQNLSSYLVVVLIKLQLVKFVSLFTYE